MILVDIQTPALDKIYDFELDGEQQTGRVLEEIIALILQRENLAGEPEGKLRLYAMRQEKILSEKETLEQQGVEDGDRLVLF